MPSKNVVFGGSDGKRTVTVTPATNQSGTAIITVTVSDGLQTASNQFTIVVRPQKKQLHLTVPEVTAAGPIQFMIRGGDPGDTVVLEASDDFSKWFPMSTNIFPASLCIICPFIAVGDPIAESKLRFYRAINR